MGRKSRIKKERDREAFLVAKRIGNPTLIKTSHGEILLNTTKHYCLQEPYENEEYESRMFYEMKRRREAYENAKKENE